MHKRQTNSPRLKFLSAERGFSLADLATTLFRSLIVAVNGIFVSLYWKSVDKVRYQLIIYKVQT